MQRSAWWGNCQSIMTNLIPTDRSIPFQMRGSFHAFEMLMQRALRDRDLQLSHFYVLRVLWEENGIPQKRVAQQTFTTESTAAQVLAAMERLGLVERHYDPADKRRRIVHLTAKANDMREGVVTLMRSMYERVTAGLDQGTIDNFLAINARLRKNLDAEYERRFDS